MVSIAYALDSLIAINNTVKELECGEFSGWGISKADDAPCITLGVHFQIWFSMHTAILDEIVVIATTCVYMVNQGRISLVFIGQCVVGVALVVLQVIHTVCHVGIA